MHVRASRANSHSVVYSVEKTILIGQLGVLRKADNELCCGQCRQTMRITKANVDDEKRAGSSRPTRRTRLSARTGAAGAMLSAMVSLHPSFLLSEQLIRESRVLVEQTARLVWESKRALKTYTRFGSPASLFTKSAKRLAM
jgi:hypothetical protein